MRTPDGDIRLLFACFECSRNSHYDCAHLTSGAWCSCACPWLFRKGEPMIPADDFDDDDLAAEDLPDPDDPTSVPPDEGDAGQATR